MWKKSENSPPPFPPKKTKNFLLSPPVLSSRWVLDDPVFPPSKKGKKKKKKKSSEGDLPQKRKGEEGKTFIFPVIYGLRWPNGKEKAVEICGKKINYFVRGKVCIVLPHIIFSRGRERATIYNSGQTGVRGHRSNKCLDVLSARCAQDRGGLFCCFVRRTHIPLA